MVNLIKVKRTSIPVAMALAMLICVRRNFYVNRIRYVRVYTRRHYGKRKSYYRDVFSQTSNHEEELAL